MKTKMLSRVFQVVYGTYCVPGDHIRDATGIGRDFDAYQIRSVSSLICVLCRWAALSSWIIIIPHLLVVDAVNKCKYRLLVEKKSNTMPCGYSSHRRCRRHRYSRFAYTWKWQILRTKMRRWKKKIKMKSKNHTTKHTAYQHTQRTNTIDGAAATKRIYKLLQYVRHWIENGLLRADSMLRIKSHAV